MVVSPGRYMVSVCVTVMVVGMGSGMSRSMGGYCWMMVMVSVRYLVMVSCGQSLQVQNW